MGLALIGLAIGLPAALLLSRVLSATLFEISGKDPVTFVCVAIFCLITAFAASYLPARRASALNPAAAIRCD
jgi:putative ABC transport system permease protein